MKDRRTIDVSDRIFDPAKLQTSPYPRRRPCEACGEEFTSRARGHLLCEPCAERRGAVTFFTNGKGWS